MVEFDAELVDALNALLEDERASVEMEVALASGATEFNERAKLMEMGAEDVSFCVTLRERLEQASSYVTHRINGVVFQALGAERYDDRLLVLAHHQMVINDRCRTIGDRPLDPDTRSILLNIMEAHIQHIAWCEHRAEAFAATRLYEFRAPQITPGASGPDGDADNIAPAAQPEAASEAPEGQEGDMPPNDPPELRAPQRRGVGRGFGPYVPGPTRMGESVPYADDYDVGY